MIRLSAPKSNGLLIVRYSVPKKNLTNNSLIYFGVILLEELWSATLGHFDVPRTRTKLGSRAFSVSGPAAWNSLPASILELTSTNSFKRQLDTFISNRIRTCCLIVLIAVLIVFMYSHIHSKAPLAELYFVKGAIEVL